MRTRRAPVGWIFDIQSYAVHDGPGIRTLVFLKGCPLACAWCSNPEGRSFTPQILYQKKLCESRCEKCLEACPQRSLTRDHEALKINFSSCRLCDDFTCAAACPTGALRVCGYQFDSEALAEKVSCDRSFFGEDGGVTLSGGEPFAQPEFLLEALRQCKNRGIRTAVETCLYAPFEHIERALPFIDFFMFDVKLLDEARHAAYCGVGNRLILENIRAVARRARIPLLPRMPVVPEVNDDRENVRDTAAFLNEVGIGHVNLIPYMRLGVDKYEQVGLRYTMAGVPTPERESVKRIVASFEAHGITCL